MAKSPLVAINFLFRLHAEEPERSNGSWRRLVKCPSDNEYQVFWHGRRRHLGEINFLKREEKVQCQRTSNSYKQYYSPSTMKKTFISCLLIGMALEAHAQSSVTLYGRLDEALEYMSGVPTNPNSSGIAQGSTNRFRIVAGNWQGSFWGIKGAEDLGSGNKILFQLESGFNIATGQGSSAGIFNRWAQVGVSNSSYGTIMMGRQLFIANDVWDFDPFGQSFWASATLVRGRNWPFSSNNISYQSPKIGGFDFAGQYSFSNATNFNGNGTTPQAVRQVRTSHIRPHCFRCEACAMKFVVPQTADSTIRSRHLANTRQW
ncbi:hypothetical protein CBA19CS42_30415 [Caballeronia novacaledonica]|uniref:Porin domain-containing protein n=1 Tax=Caballeronia novacaledonica TaxID=1544861 RepID=A0AA37MRY5_9BURK|nr:hypothetical protein CBA19CS42_30415 [Caballeronia novacaledonica]